MASTSQLAHYAFATMADLVMENLQAQYGNTEESQATRRTLWAIQKESRLTREEEAKVQQAFEDLSPGPGGIPEHEAFMNQIMAALHR